MDQVVNWPQISGILDRVVLVGLTWVASKGWITPTDVAGLATLIVGIAGAVYSFYINRNSSLASRAAAIPGGTTVITTPAIAAATPEKNVVSNADLKVVRL